MKFCDRLLFHELTCMWGYEPTVSNMVKEQPVTKF